MPGRSPFSGLCNGAVLGPFWIEGSMIQFVYKDLLEEKIWPFLRHREDKEKLFFMQDGAKCHTTHQNLALLQSKFGGRVITNKTNIPWPPNSPDLNPLDFFLLGSHYESYLQNKTLNNRGAEVHC